MSKARIEALLALAVSLIAIVLFFDRINWVSFLILFWVIDAFGYWPGVIATKVLRRETLPAPFYHLYNSFHSLAGVLTIIIIYAMISGEAYSTLAIALHISIDRGILGNSLKSPEQPYAAGKL